MKVNTLKKGMMIAPAGDHEVFIKYSRVVAGEMQYITVRSRPPTSLTTFNIAMYLGTREDLGVDKKEFAWSNRFVLVGEEVVAMDPSSWIRVKEAL